MQEHTSDEIPIVDGRIKPHRYADSLRGPKKPGKKRIECDVTLVQAQHYLRRYLRLRNNILPMSEPDYKSFVVKVMAIVPIMVTAPESGGDSVRVSLPGGHIL